jgi:peroxiredoxin
LEEDTNPDALFYFKTVKVIPDGAAHFTRGMGMSCIWEDMGERSWRYSAVINNGTIEKLFVEQPFVQNSGPDPFDVSDATTMLKYLLGIQQQNSTAE